MENEEERQILAGLEEEIEQLLNERFGQYMGYALVIRPRNTGRGIVALVANTDNREAVITLLETIAKEMREKADSWKRVTRTN